jgi:hypothetical protein
MKLYRIYGSYEVCCLYCCFVYHILSYSSGSVLYNCICTYGMFCILLFNFANYVYIFLLLCVCTVLVILFYWVVRVLFVNVYCRLRLKCDGTR